MIWLRKQGESIIVVYNPIFIYKYEYWVLSHIYVCLCVKDIVENTPMLYAELSMNQNVSIKMYDVLLFKKFNI